MNEPLINIITRASRKHSIKRSVDSVLNQTYKNIHHIITYENDEILNYLQTITNPDITTLVRVPQYKQIDNLYMSYMHHDHYSNWAEPNWEFLDRKVHLSSDGIVRDRIPVKPVKYEKHIGGGAIAWCTSLDHAARKIVSHFPPNLYLKIAEGYLKEGWVLYLDDDDTLFNNTIIEEVSSCIQESTEDTLHYIKTRYKKGAKDSTPPLKHWEYMKLGHPPIYGEIGSCNIIFHSRYSKYTVWDEWRAADNRSINALHNTIPGKNFIDKELVLVN
jgi:glycosyltransferase involved in cell wall biosynthesis